MALRVRGAARQAPGLAGDTLSSLSSTIDLAIGGAAGLTMAVLPLILRRHTGKLALRAEAAYPGPLK
jgi:hypothetical protein